MPSFTKKVLYWYLLVLPLPSVAEGIIDINPYVSSSINYDDNVFRFSSPAQAQATFGSSETSDVVKRVDVGADINLRFSRQLITLSTNVNKSNYNRFDILDNTGSDYRIGWNWRLGNDFYGVLSAGKSQAIAGFNEIRNPIKNTRTFTRQLASVNWNLHPDWTLNASREEVKSDNELSNFNALDRKDEIIEAGMRYQNTLATQLGLSYRVINSSYPNRTGFSQSFFGDESKQESVSVTAAWLPTPKTRISTRLSQVKITYNNTIDRDFSGFNQRWDISHALTGKLNISATAYKEASPIEDILSTYVESTGASFSPVWNITSKVSLRGSIGYEQRDYLGRTGFFAANNANLNDESKTASLSMFYTPTDKSSVQLQYQGEKRTSNIENLRYSFNNLNFLVRYDF